MEHTGGTSEIFLSEYAVDARGAFVIAETETRREASQSGSTTQPRKLEFDASAGSSSDNPTAGHTAEEVRPCSISFPFLIAY